MDKGTAATVDFEQLFQRHRRELGVHCYRMTGSFTESEDLVQETFIRAMRSWDRFEGRSSVRAWLYRIATNLCIDTLRRRSRRRVLPFDVMDPVGEDGSIPETGEHDWIEPYPLFGSEDHPESVVHRETIELAFVAAIQHLSPRQRAVFICRDVLGWSAKQSAIVCDTSGAAVKSALQRARATMRDHLADQREEWAPAAVSDDERSVLDGYIQAHEGGDADVLAGVLRADLRTAYPQIPLWSDSRDAFIRATREFAPPGDYRFVATAANSQPAVAIYRRPPEEDRFSLVALEVLRVEDGRVAEIVDFYLPDILEAFGLPLTLE